MFSVHVLSFNCVAFYTFRHDSLDCRTGLDVQYARELRLGCVREASELRFAQTKTSCAIKIL